MKAYSICKDRLDKVQATLGKYLRDGGVVGGSADSTDGDGRLTCVIPPTTEMDGQGGEGSP